MMRPEEMARHHATLEVYCDLQRARDAVLAPTDLGERGRLGEGEVARLEQLDATLAQIYPSVLAAEAALIAAARVLIASRPDLLDLHPECSALTGRRVPPGQWDQAVACAVWMTRTHGPGDEASGDSDGDEVW